MPREIAKFLDDRAWVSYISPYTLVVPDDENPFSVDWDGINANEYDHGKLCLSVGMLPIPGLAEVKLAVCYDGALAVPRLGKYQNKENAIELFNRVLCQLLIGGILCKALDTKDVVGGPLAHKLGIWPVDFGESASAQLHGRLRMRVGGSVERAILFQPKHISFSKFQNSLSIGKSVLDSLVNLTPEFLLRGVTEISYKYWSLALSNLWITIEQLTDHLWKKHFLVNESYNPKQPILGRTKSLLEDNRTWSVSVKQEILFQSKIIDQSVFGTLYPARQSRNRLVHDGKSVDKKTALNAFVAVKELLSVCMENSQLPLRDVDPFRIRFFRERDDSKEPIKAEGTNSGGKVVKANFNEWIEISKTF